jgi:hypothetical protein
VNKVADEASSDGRVHSAPSRCANCEAVLDGPYCSRCGQKAIDLHRPFGQWLSQLIDDAFSLDTRLARTLRPLLFRPGLVTREYLAGRRATYAPPLRTYLIAALVFFGLFAIFPNNSRVEVFMQGEKSTLTGSRMTFELPAHVPFIDARYQQAAQAAKKNPQEFARVLGAQIPRSFFVLLPLFALLLELFYRREGYYLDHLVFSLYYHSFVFIVFAAFFLLSWTEGLLPDPVRATLGTGLLVWLLSYLPLALRRVYGGSWLKTLLKLAGLGGLYLMVFLFVQIPLMVFVVLSTF